MRKAVLSAGQDGLGVTEDAAKQLYGFVNMHHDFAWARRDWFIAHGIDVNDPQYGRWVAATRPGGKRSPANAILHQGWSRAFDDAWGAFIASEANLIQATGNGFTTAEVLQEMNRLRGLFPAGGILP